MGRPPKQEIPTSAARLSIQLSPEAQQVFNEIMKSEGIKDRSLAMDKIVMDYGEKVKKIKPALLIKTKEGISELETRDEPLIEESPRKSIRELIGTISDQMQLRTLAKTLNEMEKEGKVDLDKLIYLTIVDRMVNRTDSEKGGYSDLMPLFLFKMLPNNSDQQQQLVIQTLKEEIKELKQALKTKNESPEIKELAKAIETLKEDKKWSEIKDLIKTALEKKEGPSDVVKIITELEKIRQQGQKDVEAARAELAKFKDKLLMEELKEIRKKIASDESLSKKMREKIDEVLVKNFEKAMKQVGGEKSGAELAKDLIESTVEKIKEPVLAPLGKSLAEKIRIERQQPIFIPVEQTEKAVEQPASQPAPTPVLENPKKKESFSDLVQISEEKK